MTVGRILVNEKDKGSGFALATPHSRFTRVVLTANHVVRNQEASSFQFITQAGRRIPVERVERDDDLDAAVLHLSEDVPDGLVVGRALEGAAWQVETQPLGNDPKLMGTVSATHQRLVKDSGHETFVLQLQVEQILDEYKGYSGSPVALKSPDGAVIGILVEQLPSRLSGPSGQTRRATNVLYAIPIQDVLDRFGLTAAAVPMSGSRLPPPPTYAVDRGADVGLIKSDLLSDTAEPITGGRRFALVGMGGVGKTVLATQLARDRDVQHAFPGEVRWLDLDEKPLVYHQAKLTTALGDVRQDFADWVQGRDRLSQLLAERTCLLILDNVQQAAELDAFDALGPRGRLLFTTRDAGLAAGYAANMRHIDLLPIELARKLLASWAGLNANDLPPEANGVLERCGGLSLAIAMAGAMVRNRPERWSSLLQKLTGAGIDRIAARIPGYPYPNLLAALDVSVEDLDAAGQERGLRAALDRYVDLAVFKGRGAVPESALVALWASAGIDETMVGDYVALFIDRSLAIQDAEGRLGLHDLQMEDVIGRARGQLQALHTRQVDGYARHSTAGWATVPDDGYFYQHFPHHLSMAGRIDELHALLANAVWIRTKLSTAGVVSLVADYALIPDDASLQLIGEALRLSAQGLARDTNLLEGQLLGRLADREDETVQSLLAEATRSRTGAWLRPLTQSLTCPGSLLNRVLLQLDYSQIRSVHRVIGSENRTDRIEGVALSANGRVAVCQTKHVRHRSVPEDDWASWIATGNQELISMFGRKDQSELVIWDLGSLEGPRKLRPPHPLGHLAMNSDGRLTAFATPAGNVEIVDLLSGVVINEITIKPNPTAIALADNPVRIVVGHSYGWVACWEPDGGSVQMVKVFEKNVDIRAVALSGDGNVAVVMSNEGDLVRLPLPDMQPAHNFGFHERACGLAFSPDSPLVVTGGVDGSLFLWDLEHGQPGHPAQALLSQHEEITSLSVIEGNQAITSFGDGTIQMWDLTNGRVLASTTLDDPISHLAVSREGHRAIALLATERVVVLDLTALNAESWVARNGRPTSVAVTPDGRIAFAGSTRAVLTRFDILTEGGSSGVQSRIVATSSNKDGRLSFSGDWSGAVTVFDVNSQQPYEYPYSQMRIDRLAVTPNGRRVVWGTSDRQITLWEGADHPPHSVFWGRGGIFNSIVTTPTGLVIATSSDGEIIYGDVERETWRKWDKAGMVLGDGDFAWYGDKVLCAAAPDEQSRLMGTNDGLLVLERREGSMLRVDPHRSSVKALAITPDGTIIVSGGNNGTVAVWQPHLSTAPRVVSAHSNPVRVVAVSPDGRFAISGSKADDLTLWALPDLTPIASFQCDGRIEDVALAASASLVVVADSTSGVHLLVPVYRPEAV